MFFLDEWGFMISFSYFGGEVWLWVEVRKMGCVLFMILWLWYGIEVGLLNVFEIVVVDGFEVGELIVVCKIWWLSLVEEMVGLLLNGGVVWYWMFVVGLLDVGEVVIFCR